jgi:ABC-type dipeptide/oligopeptide/nickel transport system permease component
MTAYILRRLGYSVFVLWGALTIVFVAVRVVPGDPAQLIAGPQASQADVAVLRHQLGLDRSLPVQYARFFGQVARLDLGDSLRLNQPAIAAVAGRFKATATLAFSAMLIAALVSFPLGVAAALRPRSLVDALVSLFSLLGQSVPNFWLGLMFILIFARRLRWLPSSGIGGLNHLVLPALTLALPLVGVLTRLIRTGLLEVLGEEYIRTAQAKGLSQRVVIAQHALRNMFIPVITVAGLQLGSLLGGAVIVETVFGWPGAGQLLVTAIGNRDYPVVQAGVLMITGGFILINLLVDVSYGYLDPRVRYG